MRKVSLLDRLILARNKNQDLSMDDVLEHMEFVIEILETVDVHVFYSLRFLPAQTVLKLPEPNTGSKFPWLL